MKTDLDSFEHQYSLRIRFASIIVIFSAILLMYIFPKTKPSEDTIFGEFIETIETFEIPQTFQLETPPPPSRPSIPVESDDDDFPIDVTIPETELDNFDWEGPPDLSNGPNIVFIAYDVAPVPIGGWARFIRSIVYPVRAREMRVAGIVTVQAFITKGGRVTETHVLRGFAGTGLDEAAITALKRTRWKPAMQRDKKVGVWISIPVRFDLEQAVL